MRLQRYQHPLVIRTFLILFLATAVWHLSGCSSTGPRTGPKAENANATANSSDEDARALQSINDRSWFDAERQGYRTPRPPADPDNPLRRTGRQATPTTANPAKPVGGGGGTGIGGELVGYVVLSVLGIGLVALAVFLGFVSLRSWHRSRQDQLLSQAIDIDPTRVVDLPFEAQVEMRDPLAYARTLMERGDYDGATLYIYGYMLLGLDRASKIFLHRGKTNRMYLMELHDEHEIRGLLVPAMLAFEDVYFGRHSIDRDRFLKIWTSLDAFHRALAPTIALAQPLEEVSAS